MTTEVIIQYLKEYKIMGYETPGISTLIVVANDGKIEYHLRCFKCGFTASLVDHKVNVVNERATISPSIMCPVEKCNAHYYIRDGRVEDC